MRRIFFVIPDVPHARRIVDELQAAGIGTDQMHTWSKSSPQLSGLPVASEAQGQDRAWALDKLLWNADLILFALATSGLVVAAVYGSVGWAIAALAVMLGSYLFGRWFAIKVPHTHLSDMRVPLGHGEIVLMVDVAKERVREVERLVSRHHPETEVGGVGWSSPILGT
jgi:hypothetical protein